MGQADETDTLVLFFAGHTLTSDEIGNEVYLVTHDLDPTVLSGDPDAGLGMDFLRRHVLGAFRGTALVILDCCRAGSLVGSPDSDFDLISRPRRGESQFCVLMACASDGYARETPEFGHGVLTHYILEALRGRVADNRGRVTMQAVAGHVLDQTIEPRPGVAMQAWGGTTPLTTPGFRAASGSARHAAAAPVEVLITPLEGPLDRYVEVLSGVIARLARRTPAHAANDAPLSMVDRLKAVTQAKSVALLERGADGFTPIDRTARFDLDDVRPLLVHLPAARPWFGHAMASAGTNVFCMPVDVLQDKVVLLAFVDMPSELVAMGQVLAKVLETVWTTNFPENSDEAEIEVLTALRRTFGRLPDALYERCLHLYRTVLESFVMAFQPVITLSADAQGVGVHSYEALARRSADDTHAPIAMLQVAQDWGDSFKIERDSIIVRTALVAYAEAHVAGPWSEDLPKPVSVNVSVRSLLNDDYISAVEDAIALSGIEPAKVTLEISEQDPIEKRRGERWRVEPHTYFHQRLVDLACKVGVRFAVDDFGVGHATVSRVAELPLTQIKTDRAMLHHPQAAAELALVVEVARDPLNRGTTHIGRDVIVEGVDDESPLTLKEIFDQKVRYVQGYITRTPASTQLSALSADVRQDIAARVRGENDERPFGIAGRDPARSELPLRRGA